MRTSVMLFSNSSTYIARKLIREAKWEGEMKPVLGSLKKLKKPDETPTHPLPQ